MDMGAALVPEESCQMIKQFLKKLRFHVSVIALNRYLSKFQQMTAVNAKR